ncbi:YdcH family protein [Shewanella surugensis]|uniref:YdcH family protein n=1 Tax=Shewanella surugensis TaxID=212020 RepID=A0ABT0LJ57_9GAMM|nr:YdcH family protein [Shewanella surugensis]MCL1127744.1 YdcH family protein [Shewanella surugensis]
MLGESHALIFDFPEYRDAISSLNSNDQDFSNKAARYHELDLEIRRLELKGSPVSDDTMHQLKHERSALKDHLFDKMKNQAS